MLILPNNPISETIFSRTAQLRGEFPLILRLIRDFFATFFFVALFDLHIMHRTCRCLLPRMPLHFTVRGLTSTRYYRDRYGTSTRMLVHPYSYDSYDQVRGTCAAGRVVGDENHPPAGTHDLSGGGSIRLYEYEYEYS